MYTLATVVLLFFLFVVSLVRISIAAADTILVHKHISDGENITSAGGTFQLGFFSPGNSKDRYVGIWYSSVPEKVVWVANRETPVTDSSGVFKMNLHGILLVVNGTNHVFWLSNSYSSAEGLSAQLLETGNLVVKIDEDWLWQSFDHPGNTLLPGMKLGWNRATGLDRQLSSWKSLDDPSAGNFTCGIDLTGFPQLLLKSGSTVKFRAGIPELTQSSDFTYKFVYDEEEIYLAYDVGDSSDIRRLQCLELTPDGNLQRLQWTYDSRVDYKFELDSINQWREECDTYDKCGANGICNIKPVNDQLQVHDHPVCECMNGFLPKFQRKWDRADWSDGCVRRTPLDCLKGDVFVKYTGIKLPDTRSSWFNESMDLIECAGLCLRNCSCTAYANSYIRGSGCLLWFHDLIDIRNLPAEGQQVYVRMAASQSAALDTDKNAFPGRSISFENKRRVIAISTSITGIILLSLVLTFSMLKKRKRQLKRKAYMEDNPEGGETNDDREHLELPLFDFDTLLNATSSFSSENKLGEGGFGPVYKGILQDGQEIAVKMMSKASRQGLKEFRNEVESIAKLQHRNLVKLLGCCIRGRERMLIYEYLPNKSLDFFIFGEKQTKVLDWQTRYLIINGIARGLLYLHQDSRLRIIHRDLKAENVLLDNEMNPKISDFGIARSFQGNETEANTTRVAGTLGYMSPEYACEGLYSTKSDVFSFGVLVLEIISGQRNRGFIHSDHSYNLLGHAWTLYMEDRLLEFMDASMGNVYNMYEVIRSINLGLLCVQRFPDDRPSMHSVVVMFSSDVALPQPKEPCFFTDRNMIEATVYSCGTKSPITLLEAR